MIKAKKYLVVLINVLFLSCAIPHKTEIQSALRKSDYETCVNIASKEKKTANFLANQILIEAASHGETKTTLVSIIQSSGREITPVIKILRNSKDPEIKAVALMKLYTFGEKNALTELKPFIESHYGLARAFAVEAFLKNKQDESFYRKFITDTEVEVRLRVVRNLINSKFEWKQEVLRETATKDPELRVKALALMALDPTIESNIEILKENVLNGTPALVSAALSALGSNPALAEEGWLRKFLLPPVTEMGIRFASRIAFASMQGNKFAQYLNIHLRYLEDALKSPSPSLRIKALWALTSSNISLNEAQNLSEDKNPEVLLAYAMYSRKMYLNSKKRIEILKKLSENKNKDLAIRSIIALCEERDFKYSQIRNKLWNFFKKGSSGNKIYILSFVGLSINDSSLALIGMSDKDPAVRIHSASAYLRSIH